MRTKKIIYTLCTFAAILVSTSARGQVNPATAFYWENPYYINPAFVNEEALAYFSLSARKQWMTLPGSPVTIFGTGTFYWEKYKTQVGVKILNDKIGFLTSSDIALTYAYSLALRDGRINMGLALAYQLQSTDRNKVSIEEENDPSLANILESRKQWNGGLGFEYASNTSFRVGISTQNMFSFFRKEGTIFSGTNYLYGRYRTRIMGRAFRPTYRTSASPTTYDMEWGICLKQYEQEFQADGVISFYLNHPTQKEKFQLSLLGRTTGEVGVLVGIKLISEMKILGCYDYNIKALQGHTKGTFEVIVTYPLAPKKCVSAGY